MTTATQELHKIFLYPANIAIAYKPTCISTLLGTCIAVCLWDTKSKIGGMNHYLLPLWNGEGLASPKYGNIAIQKLIEKMESMGAERKNLIAKVFGGKAFTDGNSIAYNIGVRNIYIAQEMLRDYNIAIKASDVGGEFGRTIRFDTSNGTVMMKYIKGVKYQ